MNLRTVAVSGVLLAALSACSGTDATISVEALRQTATDAGATPSECPLDYDIDAALDAADVDADAAFDAAEGYVSEATTPAADPLAAQTEGGLSPLEVSAGAGIDCDYTVGGGTLEVDLATSINDKFWASGVFVARLDSADDDLKPEQIGDILDKLGEPGNSETTTNGKAVMISLHTTDDIGTAAVFVTSDIIKEDQLRTVAEQLVDDLDQS